MRWRGALIAASVLLAVACTGCWSFTKNGMIGVVGGTDNADVAIYRHATRRLLLPYDGTAGTATQKTAAVALVLRTAADNNKVTGFVKDRWYGATHTDQYGEIRYNLLAARNESRCLAVLINAGWFDFGYDWHYHDLDHSVECKWGVDPL